MMRRILILNLGLMVLLGFGGVKIRQDWKIFDSTHQTSAIKARNEILPGLPTGTTPAQISIDWTIIPTRNPFSFDRNDITIPAPAEPQAPAKPIGPKPVLFGVMNIGTNRLAIVGQGGGTGANRNSRTVKAGETIDGWTVVQIEDKSITVEGNSTRESIIINDPSSQIQRDHTRTLAGDGAAAIQSVSQAAPAATKPSAPVVAPAAVPAPGGQVQPDGTQIIDTIFGPRKVTKGPPEK